MFTDLVVKNSLNSEKLFFEAVVYEKNSRSQHLSVKDVEDELNYVVSKCKRIFKIPNNRKFILKRPTSVSSYSTYQWIISRAALTESFKKIIKKKELLADEPVKIFFSITHSKDIALAICGFGEGLKGIGVDVEYSDRKLDKRLDKRISNCKDTNGFSTLDKWVAKEAAYKAISNNKKIVMSDIVIKKTLDKKDSFLSKFKSDDLYIRLGNFKNKYTYALALNAPFLNRYVKTI